MRNIKALGAITLSLALVMVTQLVLSAVFGHAMGNVAAGAMAALILLMWWVLPKVLTSSGKL